VTNICASKPDKPTALLLLCRLAHCSAGKYAKEYAWQQTAPEFCRDDSIGSACYCPEDAWYNMTIIPSVGDALHSFATTGSLGASIKYGVTRMLYGTIPDSWGTNNGQPAAWHKTLTSV
jgi:hypothetical protein